MNFINLYLVTMSLIPTCNVHNLIDIPFFQCLCIWCVLRLYNLLRAGVTWKGSVAIELWLMRHPDVQGDSPNRQPPCETNLLLGGAESDTDASLHSLWHDCLQRLNVKLCLCATYYCILCLYLAQFIKKNTYKKLNISDARAPLLLWGMSEATTHTRKHINSITRQKQRIRFQNSISDRIVPTY